MTADTGDRTLSLPRRGIGLLTIRNVFNYIRFPLNDHVYLCISFLYHGPVSILRHAIFKQRYVLRRPSSVDRSCVTCSLRPGRRWRRAWGRPRRATPRHTSAPKPSPTPPPTPTLAERTTSRSEPARRTPVTWPALPRCTTPQRRSDIQLVHHHLFSRITSQRF